MPWVFDPISHIPWYMQPAMTLRSDELGRSIERQKYNPTQASWQSNNAK
jgi:hypothetical protein